MRHVLVTTAYQLYIDTLELETTDINTESHKWHDLYSKECQLFDLLRQMSWEEGEEYRYQVRMYNNAHGISNEVSWEA
jgi:hypothetical protein